MTSEYRTFLAEEVLNEGKIVTFRVLSRTLGVNSHEAKRMLFDFHRTQNAKKAGSVHATYLVTGFRKPQKASTATNGTDSAKADGDVVMQTFSFPGSSMPNDGEEGSGRAIKTMTLVEEDKLEHLKSLYSNVSSVHVYSIQSAPLNNLDMITSVYEQFYADSDKWDPHVTGRTYGVIQNPKVKRRQTNGLPQAPASSSQKGTPMSSASAKTMFQKSSGAKKAGDDKKAGAPSNAVEKAKPSATDDTGVKKPADSNSGSASPAPTPSSSASRPAKVPTLKSEKSDIFKAFAKTRTPKAKAGPMDSSAHGAHSMPVGNLSTQADVQQADEDIDMGDDDDDNDNDTRLIPNKSVARGPRQTQAEREAELRRKIFDDDDDDDDNEADQGKDSTKDMKVEGGDATDGDTGKDDEMPDAPADDEGGSDADDDDGEADGMDEETDASQAKASQATQDAEEKVTVSNGRRRGRRRIVRKRMIKDAEGYLVTREEPGWESFSEEDVPAKKPLPKTPSSSAGGSKKSSQQSQQSQQKKGQGNIMSFFGKK